MDESGIPSPADIKGIGEGIGAAVSGGAAFIDKLDQATGGWWAVHKTKRQVKAAEKKMLLSKAALEDMGLELTDEEKRGIAFSALHEVKGFENLSAVMAQANIPEDAPAGDIEDEWMNRFVECSKEAFSEWKRALLADAASAKASDPRNFSISALNCIARMELQDVETLKKLRGITPDFDLSLSGPIILFKEDGLLSFVGLDVESIERLRDIGVLHEVENRIRLNAYLREPHNDVYDGKPYIVCVDNEDGHYITMRFGDEEIKYPATSVLRRTLFSRSVDLFLDLGLFSYTTSGRELVDLIPFQRAEGLSEYLTTGHHLLDNYESKSNEVDMFERRDFERSVRDVISRTHRGAL